MINHKSEDNIMEIVTLQKVDDKCIIEIDLVKLSSINGNLEIHVNSKDFRENSDKSILKQKLESTSVLDVINSRKDSVSKNYIRISINAAKAILKNGVNANLYDFVSTESYNVLNKYNYGTRKLYVGCIRKIYSDIVALYDPSNTVLPPINQNDTLLKTKYLQVTKHKTHFKSFKHENFETLEEYREIISTFFIDVINNNPKLKIKMVPELVVILMCVCLRPSETLRLLVKLYNNDFSESKVQQGLKKVSIKTKISECFEVPITATVQKAFSVVRVHYKVDDEQKFFKLVRSVARNIKYHFGEKFSITLHGFRSLFRDSIPLIYSSKKLNFDSSVAEMCLDHKVGSAVVQAYARTNLFSQRAEMVEHYAQFIQECLDEARKQIKDQQEQTVDH